MANQHGLGTIQNTLNISRGNLQATAAGGTNGKTKVLCLQSQNMLEPSCPSSFFETQSINLFWFKKVQKPTTLIQTKRQDTRTKYRKY